MLTVPSDHPIAPLQEDGGVETSEFHLEECTATPARCIEQGLAEHPGVFSASVNLATNRAFVTYDPTLTGLDDLCVTVTSIGYNALPLENEAGPGGQADPDHWVLRAAISWPIGLATLGIVLLAPRAPRRDGSSWRSPSRLSSAVAGPSCGRPYDSCATVRPAWTR